MSAVVRTRAASEQLVAFDAVVIGCQDWLFQKDSLSLVAASAPASGSNLLHSLWLDLIFWRHSGLI